MSSFPGCWEVANEIEWLTEWVGWRGTFLSGCLVSYKYQVLCICRERGRERGGERVAFIRMPGWERCPGSWGINRVSCWLLAPFLANSPFCTFSGDKYRSYQATSLNSCRQAPVHQGFTWKSYFQPPSYESVLKSKYRHGNHHFRPRTWINSNFEMRCDWWNLALSFLCIILEWDERSNTNLTTHPPTSLSFFIHFYSILFILLPIFFQRGRGWGGADHFVNSWISTPSYFLLLLWWLQSPKSERRERGAGCSSSGGHPY